MTGATRYFCPLDCGWYHDQADPKPVMPASGLPVSKQVELMLLGELMAAETVVKRHLEEHELLEWVQAVTRLRRDAASVDEVLHENGIDYPLGHRGVRDMAAQRQAYLDEWKTAEAEREEVAALAEARHRVIERMARESLEAEAAVQRVRETCDRWDGFSPTTRRHSIIVRAALGGPARHGETAPSTPVTNHTYEGTPGPGSPCQAEAFGETCSALREQHAMRSGPA